MEPTSNELKLMIGHIKESHDSILERIKEVHQDVRYTNGKVGELVKWRERVIAATTVIALIALPILAWALMEVVSMDDKIDKALANYEIQIVQ